MLLFVNKALDVDWKCSASDLQTSFERANVTERHQSKNLAYVFVSNNCSELEKIKIHVRATVLKRSFLTYELVQKAEPGTRCPSD